MYFTVVSTDAGQFGIVYTSCFLLSLFFSTSSLLLLLLLMLMLLEHPSTTFPLANPRLLEKIADDRAGDREHLKILHSFTTTFRKDIGHDCKQKKNETMARSQRANITIVA